WVDNIQQALSEADPDHAAVYQANADAYRAQLRDLDAWIREQVAAIPEENRRLVTDHMEQGYFADEYGFTLVGALIPGYSTLSEPSAKDMAEIEDAIRALGVKAVFVGNTINPTLAERVAADTGIQLVYIYSGSLSPAGGEASTYLDYMRYNVNAIVGALK
ncbi:MAG: zinc ABC transporter substrate-binding protein, partial [Anaerolineaceae bacterium]